MQNKAGKRESEQGIAVKEMALYAVLSNKKILLVGIAAVLTIFLLSLVLSSPSSGQARSESYREVSGAAGLVVTIDYDCGDSCDQKFDFNVYIYRDDGHQVNVVRPNKDGVINLALAEGNYVMLIGKQLGKDKVFPQEPLALKNGMELELKLQYKGGVL